jgi:hypothetical protein
MVYIAAKCVRNTSLDGPHQQTLEFREKVLVSNIHMWQSGKGEDGEEFLNGYIQKF